MTVDYLIIGQGLAGTLVAHHLRKRNKSIHVIDNAHKNSASKIAAGLINPVTGRKYVKSWRIDELIPASIKTYTELGQELGVDLLAQQNILRIIFDQKSERYWDDLILKGVAEKYIQDSADIEAYQDLLHEFHGVGELSGYRVNLELLISAFANVLSAEKSLTTEDFNYSSLEINDHFADYKVISATHVIFCDGARAIHNPFFNYLPFQPAKGEAIKFVLDDFESQKILRHKQFIIPMDGQFWSGGGYEWEELNEEPTLEFKEKWLLDMQSMIVQKPQIISHKAAVRPAVKGRRPLLGTHPKYKNLHIFNGLGTKGSSLAPLFVQQFINHILGLDSIDEEVSIDRFQSLY